MTKSEANAMARESIANLEREYREREGLLIDYAHPKPFIQGFLAGVAWATERAAGIVLEATDHDNCTTCEVLRARADEIRAQGSSEDSILLRFLIEQPGEYQIRVKDGEKILERIR